MLTFMKASARWRLPEGCGGVSCSRTGGRKKSAFCQRRKWVLCCAFSRARKAKTSADMCGELGCSSAQPVPGKLKACRGSTNKGCRSLGLDSPLELLWFKLHAKPGSFNPASIHLHTFSHIFFCAFNPRSVTQLLMILTLIRTPMMEPVLQLYSHFCLKK